MADLQSVLAAAPIPQSVRADAWDAYQAAAGPQDLAGRLQKLAMPNSVKADLWDMKNAATLAVNMRPQNVAPSAAEDDSQQGFWHSLYQSGIKPTADMVKDIYKRGGIPVAEDFARSIYDQMEKSEQTGDIRDFPVIGT